jgi:mono/diheme cytochrome c family protein
MTLRRIISLVGLGGLFSSGVFGQAPAPLDFGRDIFPILSNNCFTCHGPDDENRRAKLRLDTHVAARGRSDAAAGREGETHRGSDRKAQALGR